MSKLWRNKWFWVMLVAALLISMGFMEVFPDPYYHTSNVNFYVWVYREIDELIHGER